MTKKTSMFMPIGKHKGKQLSEIPLDYLEWMIENCTNLRTNLKDAIQEELMERDCINDVIIDQDAYEDEMMER
jgi:hypothetical protein